MGMFDKVKESLTKKEYTCDQCGATVLRAPLLADHQKEVLCPACTQKRREERERIDRESKGILDYTFTYHVNLDFDFSNERGRLALEKRAADLAKYSLPRNVRREDIQKIGERYREMTAEEMFTFYFNWDMDALDDDCGINVMMSSQFLALMGYPGVIADVDDVFAIVYYTPKKLKLKDGLEAMYYIFFTNNPYVPVCHRMEAFKQDAPLSVKEQREKAEERFVRNCKKLTYPLMHRDEFEKLVKKEGEVRGELKKKFVLDQLSFAHEEDFQYQEDKLVYHTTEETMDFLEGCGVFTRCRLHELLGFDDLEVAEYWEKKVNEGLEKMRETAIRENQGGGEA